VPHSPRIPSYHYHKASPQAVVVLDGRSHYLGAWDSPVRRAEYDRLIAEYLAGRRRRTLAGPGRPGLAPSDLTVNELILAFVDHAAAHYRAPDGRPTRHLDNLRDALRPVRALCGPTLVPRLRAPRPACRPRGDGPRRHGLRAFIRSPQRPRFAPTRSS
jgi:hypothetical protein